MEVVAHADEIEEGTSFFKADEKVDITASTILTTSHGSEQGHRPTPVASDGDHDLVAMSFHQVAQLTHDSTKPSRTTTARPSAVRRSNESDRLS